MAEASDVSGRADARQAGAWTPRPRGADGIREYAADDAPLLSYPVDGLETLGLDGGGGYWIAHRAALAGRRLRDVGVTEVWDIGAGNGAMAERLAAMGLRVMTIEPDRAGAAAAARRGLDAYWGTLQDLALPDGALPACALFDVLEHLADPRELLDEIFRVVAPGGYVLLTVPAFQTLWSDADRAAGHHRRYTKTTLRRGLVNAGFHSIGLEYLFAGLVLPAVALRVVPWRLGRRRSDAAVLASMRSELDVHPLVERSLALMLRFEAACARIVPLPAGLSLLGLFQKPPDER